MYKLQILPLVACLLVCQGYTIISPIYAAPSFYTWGSLDQALPLSAAELGSSPSIAMSNPASLAWLHSPITLGISYAREHLTWRRHSIPNSTRISNEIYQAKRFTMSGQANDALPLIYKPLPSTNVPKAQLDKSAKEHLYLQIGLHKPLIRSSKWGSLHLGTYMMIPLQRFELQKPFYPDERAQYFDQKVSFERWGDYLEGMSAAFALAYAPTADWSIGFGLNLLNKSFAQSDVFLADITGKKGSYIAPNVTVESMLSPFASIEGRWHRWALHMSVHAAEEITVSGQSKVKIWSFPYPNGQESIVQTFTKSYRALPLRSRLGLAWRGTDFQWATHLGWTQWSQFHNRHAEETQWIDQWETGVGVIWNSSWSQIALDTRWRPSPVPSQIGRSSYIDPNQWAWSLGLEYPLHEHLSLIFNMQLHLLLARQDLKDQKAKDPVIDEFPASINEVTQEKIDSSVGLQTNNPGYPGYDSSGFVWSTTLALRFQLGSNPK